MAQQQAAQTVVGRRVQELQTPNAANDVRIDSAQRHRRHRRQACLEAGRGTSGVAEDAKDAKDKVQSDQADREENGDDSGGGEDTHHQQDGRKEARSRQIKTFLLKQESELI